MNKEQQTQTLTDSDINSARSNDSNTVDAAGRSEFQKWKDQHEITKSGSTVSTTLEQQAMLASRIWNEAAGKPDVAGLAAQVQEILEALQQTPVGDKECIVSWKGFRVGWFLDVFCKTPYMQRLLEFGCELWFVRKVCIIEIIRQAHCAVNKDTTAVPVLSGPFVNFVDTVVSGLGLEGDADEIVKTPTTFISYTGGYTMQETIDMLRQLDPAEIIWMDVFCVNQFAWTGKSRSPEMKRFKDTFLEDLEKQIQAINKTVLILQDWKNVMATLGQIWVLWEIFCTAAAGSGLGVVLAPAQTDDFIKNCLESGENFGGIMASLASIDAKLARAEDDRDRKGIFARMQDAGLSSVNDKVSGAVRGWLYQRGQEYLDERRKTADGPSPSLLNNLARLIKEQGKFEEAEPLYRAALKKYHEVLGHDHPTTLTSLNNLALFLHEQGKFGEAAPLSRESLKKHQEVLGCDHPNTLTSLNNLALLLKENGKLEEAEPLFRKALEKRQKVLGRDHPDTLTSLNHLGGLLRAEGKLEEAKPLYSEALEKRQKVLGHDHPSTLTSLSNLAGLLRAQGKLDRAEPLYQESLEKHRKVLGHDHPDTLTCLNNLAGLLKKQGKLEEAEHFYRENLEKRQKMLGCDHPNTLGSMCNLALLLHQRGGAHCIEESKELLWECKTSCLAKLGADHPYTIASHKNWDSLFGGETGAPSQQPSLFQTRP